MDKSLQDLEVRAGLKKLRKLELIGVLKQLDNDASEIEKSLIRNTLKESELSLPPKLGLGGYKRIHSQDMRLFKERDSRLVHT